MKPKSSVMITNTAATTNELWLARSPWTKRCGCQGNAEGCRPRLPEGVLYARCRLSYCQPRSPPLHTDREIHRDINSYTGGERKKNLCSALLAVFTTD